MEELFDDERGEMPDIEDMDGPDILKEEVEAALRSMNDGKAPGGDSISAVMLKALDNLGLERLTDLTNKIYNTGYIPEDMKESVFIPIPKKPKATQCTEYRTISLMSHATKVLLKIILERVKGKIDVVIGENQSGFRAGKGTREGIFNLRTIGERYLEKQKDLFICYIDYEKAFDRVNHEKLIQRLKDVGLNGKDIRIIMRLYWEQTAVIRTEKGLSGKSK